MAAMDDRERLAQVEVRVEEQGGRIIELSQQIKDLDRKVDRLAERFDAKFDALDRKLDAKFDASDRKFDAKFDGVNAKFDGVNATFDSLRSEMTRQFRWTIGVMLTLAGLVAALVR